MRGGKGAHRWKEVFRTGVVKVETARLGERMDIWVVLDTN